MAKRIYINHITTGSGAETVFDKDVNSIANGDAIKFLSLEVEYGDCYLNFDGTVATLDGKANEFMATGDSFQSPGHGQIGEYIPSISIMRSGTNDAKVRGYAYI